MSEEYKPKRLYFKSYLKFVENSVGSKAFSTFYIEDHGRELDALADGQDSCAFYVSAVLKMFGKINRLHGLVKSTLEDLESSGWKVVKLPKPGDVLVWEPREFKGKMQEHIGFYVGKNQAISTSWTKQCVIKHASDIDGRKVIQIYRMAGWDDDS